MIPIEIWDQKTMVGKLMLRIFAFVSLRATIGSEAISEIASSLTSFAPRNDKIIFSNAKALIIIFISFFIVCLYPEAIDARESKLAKKFDRREEAVERYLFEFAGSGVKMNYPKIYKALDEAFCKLPQNVFKTVTDRRHPVVVIVNLTSGTAKYANSTEFRLHEGEPPAFTKGFYLLKLGDELENSASPEAIEGIIFHELAHRYLEHLSRPEFSCDMEREANRTVKKWGFTKEYEAAHQVFGAKHKGESPCYDEAVEQKGRSDY